MPCNKSNAQAWAPIAPTWTYCALECLWVPASLCALAVHLAVRWVFADILPAHPARVAQQFQAAIKTIPRYDPRPRSGPRLPPSAPPWPPVSSRTPRAPSAHAD